MRNTNFKSIFLMISAIAFVGGAILFDPVVSNAATSNKDVYDVCTKDKLLPLWYCKYQYTYQTKIVDILWGLF